MVGSIHEAFLIVDGYIMDECPECSLGLLRESAISGSNAVADRSSRKPIRCLPWEVWTCAHGYSLNIAE